MTTNLKLLAIFVLVTATAHAEEPLVLTLSDYEDRCNAIWHGQIIAVLTTLPYEHKTASVKPVIGFPRVLDKAIVDDDWYYEMCAVRAFEKHGIGLTAKQLGEQWLENACGTWGSSKVAVENLRRGIEAPECGHPRHNRLWWTIGPVFSADLYGAIAPGMPNEAARLAREYCSVNGYGEALDGAVLYAGAISLGFVESDVQAVLRKAVQLVDASSPYRQSVESVITMADSGRSFDEIVSAIEDRWRIEYPASNNAVANGGLAAACLWFGEGDFWKTINLASRAADFTDTDNSAASAISVIAAMHGMKALPPDLVAQLHDRIAGEKMGSLTLTPAVDESISELAKRTATIGKQIIEWKKGNVASEVISIQTQVPKTQPAMAFKLADLMEYWNADWTLERAGFGGDGVGAMPGIRGITYLDGETLVTYPRDESRGVVLHRNMKLSASPTMTFQVAADPQKAWELFVFAGNDQLVKKLIVGEGDSLKWRTIDLDLAKYAGQETTLRLYQRTLMPGEFKVPGNAYWKSIEVN